MKTYPYCKKEYEDTWSNWHNKYCCKECYNKGKTLYNIGDIVYTYDNIKFGKYFNAILRTGKIINIYKLNNVTKNGLYDYSVKLDLDNDVKIVSRFEHQIFSDKEKAKLFVDKTNKIREINREANELKNNL